MKYTYICKSCGYKEIIKAPIGSSIPNKLACEKCNIFMYQDFGSKMDGLKIGLDCQATSDYKPKNYNMSGSTDLEAYRDDL